MGGCMASSFVAAVVHLYFARCIYDKVVGCRRIPVRGSTHSKTDVTSCCTGQLMMLAGHPLWLATPSHSFHRQLAHRQHCNRSSHIARAHAVAVTDAKQALKSQLSNALNNQNRGIFGTTAATKQNLEQLLSELEQLNEVCNPAQDLQQVEGKWSLLYTTLTIKGGRKTKLGLREFVTLGDFEQNIDVNTAQAINKVHFSVTGLGNLAGSLTITAKFEAVSAKRVSIAFEAATLVPKALEQLFSSNYDLLLSIFNPQGWLDITYVDETHRIGRDDKGNVFYLQRC